MNYTSISLRVIQFVVLNLLIIFGLECVYAKQYYLSIEDRQYHRSTVDAYGKTMLPYRDYCPPHSDQYVLESFIQAVLIADESKKVGLEQYKKSVDIARQPFFAEIEKINIAIAPVSESIQTVE